MVPLSLVPPDNYLVWAPLLPTPVTQAMFWLERPPGLVRTQTVEPQEHGVEMTQSVRTYFTVNHNNYDVIFHCMNPRKEPCYFRQ